MKGVPESYEWAVATSSYLLRQQLRPCAPVFHSAADPVPPRTRAPRTRAPRAPRSRTRALASTPLTTAVSCYFMRVSYYA